MLIVLRRLPLVLGNSIKRGNDPRTSHDLEDIIYFLDNRINLVEDIITSPPTVLAFLRSEFSSLLKRDMEEAILVHMNPFTRKDRYSMLIEKLQAIIQISE